ncbi:MAG: RNase P subunit p30 family protein [Promethearchaeota archaeon]
MMRTYDLHIRFDSHENEEELIQIKQMATQLGYLGIALESPQRIQPDEKFPSLDILHRMTLFPRSAAHLRVRVKKHAQQTDLLVIHGRSKLIWHVAAEIPSIHMVMLNDVEDYLTVDSKVARIMANHDKPVELCLHNLLKLTGSFRSRLMRVMHTAIDHLERANCPFIFTSGASHSFELRAPKELEALSYLASVSEESAKIAMHETPTTLVTLIQKTQEAKPGRKS